MGALCDKNVLQHAMTKLKMYITVQVCLENNFTDISIVSVAVCVIHVIILFVVEHFITLKFSSNIRLQCIILGSLSFVIVILL